MVQHKTAGIMESVMSALSLLVVRSHSAASRPRHVASPVAKMPPGTATNALRQKESYFEMARYSRWKQ